MLAAAYGQPQPNTAISVPGTSPLLLLGAVLLALSAAGLRFPLARRG